MADVKTFVRGNNTATIICPACNTARHINAEPYRYKKHNIKVRCHCGARFCLSLDYRRHYRKLISLPGTYAVTTPGKIGGGVIHIRNISRGGLGFTVSGLHHMEKDLTLILEFHLNDKNQTKLRKEAQIRSVKGNYIGCQFPENDVVEKALGFYLQR
jgi:hypothetical protein